jgi:hypothetical protein
MNAESPAVSAICRSSLLNMREKWVANALPMLRDCAVSSSAGLLNVWLVFGLI